MRSWAGRRIGQRQARPCAVWQLAGAGAGVWMDVGDKDVGVFQRLCPCALGQARAALSSPLRCRPVHAWGAPHSRGIPSAARGRGLRAGDAAPSPSLTGCASKQRCRRPLACHLPRPTHMQRLGGHDLAAARCSYRRCLCSALDEPAPTAALPSALLPCRRHPHIHVPRRANLTLVQRQASYMTRICALLWLLPACHAARRLARHRRARFSSRPPTLHRRSSIYCVPGDPPARARVRASPAVIGVGLAKRKCLQK